MPAHDVDVLREIVWRQLQHFPSREVFEKRSKMLEGKVQKVIMYTKNN